MTFILLTGSIMAVSLFLIHHLCRFIGIEMKWVSLVLCAVMALLINAVAISMSPFLTRMHYLRLGVLVLVASAFVTLFNERLLRREERAASAAKEAPQSWADGQPVAAAACPAAVSEQDIQQELPAGDAGETPVQPASEAQPEKRPETEPETSEITKTAESAEKAGTPRQDKAAEPAEPSKSAESESPAAVRREEEAEKAAEARAESRAEELAKAKALAKEKARQAEARQAAENEARRRAAEERKARQEAEKKAKEAAQQKAREEKAAAVRQEVAAMDSLDSMLDYAYDHAESSPETAICAYQQAIARYPDDSYTPFLVIELGNLYKGQAAYQKAAEAYRQALSLPIIAANDAMKQEFIKNTRYLVIVQNILSKHHALSTPFPDIPADIMQEIETEFQKSS